MIDLSVFISSPADVKPERDAARRVVERLAAEQALWADVALQAVTWEEYGRPGIGVDAQDVLNRQMQSAIDGAHVYLGILWSRLGTPTQRASSGTVEEFQRAYAAALRSDFRRPRIMLYFKSSMPPIKTAAQAHEYQALLDFKEKLPQNVLYWEFDGVEDFEALLAKHLVAELRQPSRNGDRGTCEEVGGTALSVVEEFCRPCGPGQDCLFVYGSLLDPVSMAASIRRTPAAIEYIPARLRRHSRSWGLAHPRANLVDDHWSSMPDTRWMSLVIRSGTYNDVTPGALVQVSEEDLASLKRREEHYRLVEVSDDIEVDVEGGLPSSIWTFVPAAEDRDGERAGGSAVRRGYLEMVSRALAQLGHDDRLEVPPDVPVVHATDATGKAVGVMRERGEEAAQWRRQMETYLRDKKALLHASGRRDPIASSPVPMVVDSHLFQQVALVAEAAIRLTVKSLSVLHNRQELRVLSGFHERDFALARRDAESDDLLPRVARVDLALDRYRPAVFEVNCDSPGGMFHFDLVANRQLRLCEELGLPVDVDRVEPLCKAVINSLMDAWRKTAADAGWDRESPAGIAIVERDWELWPTRSEFLHFRERLSRESAWCEIVEPHELLYCAEDGQLLARGHPVDLIYKRLIWNDLVDEDDPGMVDAQQALLAAREHNAVCVVNSFGSAMATNKLLSAILQDPVFPEWARSAGVEYDPLELDLLNDHSPLTKVWTASDTDLVHEVLADPGSFVLKSFNGYGSKEVIIGSEVEAPERRRVFRSYLDRQYVVQSVVSHGRVMAPDAGNGHVEWSHRHYIVGAYVIDGHCRAIEAKLSRDLPISMNAGAQRTAVFPTLGTSGGR